MPGNGTDELDWSRTTWDGARREQLRRWSHMSLPEVILALEEMQALADGFLDAGRSKGAADG